MINETKYMTVENEKKKYTFKDIAWRDLLIIPIIGVIF
ncbi:hypothetical protein V530_00298 [Staphylococcus aureus F45749]|nr:hypothetical protein V530_00298 [Staphylococcus aureus F45749]